MIQMTIYICKCCNREIEDCEYQRRMRAFGLDAYVDDIWTKGEDYPPCSSLISLSKP